MQRSHETPEECSRTRPCGRVRSVGGFAALGVVLAATAVHAESSSASYVLQRVTVDAAGASAASPSYRLDASLGTESPVAASSGETFVLQSGFWSFVGATPVGVVLAVSRNATNGEHCDLAWSGNAPPYEVYAAADCSAVLDAVPTTTSDSSIENVAPPEGELACFRVLPMNGAPTGPTPTAFQESTP